MATIQIRDVPEDVHRTYHRRAAEAGMSLQEYLLSELTSRARSRTPAEIVGSVRETLSVEGDEGFSPESSRELLAEERRRG